MRRLGVAGGTSRRRREGLVREANELRAATRRLRDLATIALATGLLAAAPALSATAAPTPASLNRRPVHIAQWTSWRRAADLAIRVPVPDSALPDVLVGHGFANTGAGVLGWLAPAGARACGVGQGGVNEGSVVTHLATGTTDGWGSLFALVPPVSATAVVRPGESLWIYPLTPAPARVVVLTSTRLCGYKIPNVPPPMPPKAVGSATGQALWLARAQADGWHVFGQATTRWRAGGTLAAREEAGATTAIRVPVDVPVMVVQFVSLFGDNPGPLVNVFQVVGVSRPLSLARDPP